MKFNQLLFLSIFTLLVACNEKSTSAIESKSLKEDHPTIFIGDTVSGFDKSIWVIFQDKNNRYWFGSDGQGVYSYDGKTILHFSTKHGLLNNHVRGIQEDKWGNMYFTTLDGISQFNGRTFTTLPVTESNDWKLDPDDLWFSILGRTGEYGPYRYDGKTLHHLKFPKHYMEEEYYKNFPNMSWSPYEVYTIYKDSKKNMWFGTSNFGICRYDGTSLSWLYEEHLTLIEGGGSFGIRSIIEDKAGKFWFCNTSYRYTIYPKGSAEKKKNLIDYKREKGIEGLKAPDGKDLIYFMSAIEDKSGDLWMVTYNNGVWRYDGKNTTHYPVKDGDKDITLFFIYKDRQANLWLGTLETGVYKFNGTVFEKFKP